MFVLTSEIIIGSVTFKSVHDVQIKRSIYSRRNESYQRTFDDHELIKNQLTYSLLYSYILC